MRRPNPGGCLGNPDDVWTWQINDNYERFAHCLADALNSAPQYSWLLPAPRPITSFEQQWQADTITLRSVDPLGVEQVRIQLIPVSERNTRVLAVAKNLEALGGGAPMFYVRWYVAFCSPA